ncbi:hypothetical protein B0H16DRAFT_1578458, partial [Mycena metata]
SRPALYIALKSSVTYSLARSLAICVGTSLSLGGATASRICRYRFIVPGLSVFCESTREGIAPTLLERENSAREMRVRVVGNSMARLSLDTGQSHRPLCIPEASRGRRRIRRGRCRVGGSLKSA